MIEPPQFRTVLRGADPEQVAEALKELHTSLVVARRAAADRTIELSRLQEEHQTLQAHLQSAQRHITELEQSQQPQPAAAAGHGYGDLGSRIGSMLSLAEEEAAQMRAAAETEIAQHREHASRELAVELTAEHAQLEETKARTAHLADELGRLQARAESDRGRLRAEALHEADQIRQQAQVDADHLRRDAEQRSAAAVAQRDEVHAHLGKVAALIGGIVADGGGSGGHHKDEPSGEARPSGPVEPADSSGSSEPPERTAELAPDEDTHHDDQPDTARRGASHDATQVMALPPELGRRDVRRNAQNADNADNGDNGDSFAGEPWQHEEHNAPTR